MTKIERIALVVTFDNGITLTVPAKKVFAKHSLRLHPEDAAELTINANEILDRLKEV